MSEREDGPAATHPADRAAATGAAADPPEPAAAGADPARDSAPASAATAVRHLTPPPSRRAEIWCGALLAVAAVYAVAVLPLRPVLLSWSPDVLAALTGSRVALVALGVLARSEGVTWWWPLLAAIVSIVKFHAVFWWAGRLWGQSVLTRLAGDGPRAQRRIASAEHLVRRYQVLALVITYVPMPVPREVVHAALGASGTRLRTFLLVDLLAAAPTQSAFLLAGYLIGERAMPLLTEYARWAGVVAGGVVVLMLVRWWRRRGSRADTAT